MQDWRSAARDMVESQLIPRNIRNEEVLKVMASLPRHLFVPFRYAENTYIDRPLPIGGRQTISQPYMVAKKIGRALQKLRHLRHHVGLGDRLPSPYGQRPVDVGPPRSGTGRKGASEARP